MVGNKNIKIEESTKGAKPSTTNVQPDARKLFNRKWYPCIAVAAVLFLFLILGGALTLKAFLAGYESDKRSDVPLPDDQTSSKDSTKSNSGSKTTSNSKSSTSSDNNAAVAAEKEKMVNFFTEAALYDSADREQRLMRWNKPSVSAGVAVGAFDDQLNGCLDSFISDFNSLTNGVDLYHDNTVDLGIPNIKIFYLDEATFNARARGVSEYGYVEWDLKDDYSINRISMNISYKIKEMTPSVQCQLIRHEMMHAVGFWGHSDIFPESVMSLPKTDYSYPIVDRRIVELLYNIGLPLGSSVTDTKNFLNSNYPY